MSGKASSCLERRQGQLITKCPQWMPPALLSGCAPSAHVHGSCQSKREIHTVPWPLHKAPTKEGLINNQPVSREPLQQFLFLFASPFSTKGLSTDKAFSGRDSAHLYSGFTNNNLSNGSSDTVPGSRILLGQPGALCCQFS